MLGYFLSSRPSSALPVLIVHGPQKSGNAPTKPRSHEAKTTTFNTSGIKMIEIDIVPTPKHGISVSGFLSSAIVKG